MSQTDKIQHMMTCQACGKTVRIPASRVGKRRFCGHACRVKTLGMPKGRRKAE